MTSALVAQSGPTFASTRHGTIGAERKFGRYQRTALGHTQNMAGGDPMRGLDHQPTLNGYSRVAQTRQPTAGNTRIRILDGTYDAFQAGGDDGVGTGRRDAEVRARLQRHVHGSAAGARAGARDGLGLGVRAPARRGPAARNDLAGALVCDHRPNRRIGCRAPETARRNGQRDLHHLGVELGALRGAHHAQCFLSGAVSTTELSKAM